MGRASGVSDLAVEECADERTQPHRIALGDEKQEVDEDDRVDLDDFRLSRPHRPRQAVCSNSSHDNVYGAVIMTKVIARVHPVQLTNVD